MSGTTPTAGYEQTNFTTYDPAAYKTQIDANFMAMQRVANAFAPRAQRTPSMKVEVDPGSIWNGSSLVEIGGYCYATAQTLTSSTVPVNTTTGFANGMILDSLDGYGGANSQIYDQVTISSFTSTSVTLSAGNLFIQNNAPLVARQITGTFTAPVTNPRIDRVVGDCVTGVISVVTGTEAATPSPPAIPAGKFPIAQVALKTSSTAINNSMITDERNISGAPASPSFSAPIIAACRNLVIKQASNTTATVTYDEVVAKTGLGGASYLGASGSFTINFATTGANGLDAGSLSASTFYYIYAIYKPSTNTWAALGSTSSSSPTLPTGYTVSALIGVMLTDGSSHLLVTTQYDREVWYQSAITAGSNIANQSSLTSQSISGAVPALAKTCSGLFQETLVASQAMTLQLAADGTGTGLQVGGGTYTGSVAGATATVLNFRQLPIITAQTVYYSTGSTAASPTNSLKITSFTI